MSLSNRILGVLIIVGFIGVGYIYYQYFFVQNLVSLNIDSNIDGYDVELYNLKAQKKQNCPDKICTINEISPFEYDIKITKKDYDIYSQKINLSKNNSIKVDLKKTLVFTKIEEKNNLSFSGTTENKTRQEIIIEKTKNKKIFTLDNNKKFEFIKNKNNLALFYEGENISNFSKYDFEKLDIKKVYGNPDMIFVNSGDSYYIINTESLESYLIKLNIDILYTKYLGESNNIAINTVNGTFLYSFRDSSLIYFSKYNDFISVGENDIFILNNTDTIRKKNLSFEDENQNLIVLFDKQTKQKRILKKLDTAINKIYLEDEKVYIQDENGDLYLLDNYK